MREFGGIYNENKVSSFFLFPFLAYIPFSPYIFYRINLTKWFNLSNFGSDILFILRLYIFFFAVFYWKKNIKMNNKILIIPIMICINYFCKSQYVSYSYNRMNYSCLLEGKCNIIIYFNK